MSADKRILERDGSWVPYHSARMRFLPTFTVPGEPFRAAIETLLRRAEPDLAFTVEAYLPLSVIVTIGSIELHIDADEGTFSLDYADRDLAGSLWGFSGLPERLQEMTIDELRREDVEAVERALDVARHLWGQMADRFQRALASGRARIVGAMRDPLAEFVEIDTSRLPYLSFDVTEHCDNGWPTETVARSAQGTSVYAVHVIPHDPSTRSLSPLDRAVAWLRAEVQKSPERAPVPKAEILLRVSAECGGLSERLAEQAWKNATSGTGWQRPGAPKKPHQKSPAK